MRGLFPTGIGKLQTILAFGLVLGTIAAGRASAEDTPSGSSGCDCQGACGSSIFWYGVEPLPRDPWYFSTDGMAMQRLFRGLGPVAVMGLTPSGAVVSSGTVSIINPTVALSQQDLREPFQGGVRMTLGHTFEDTPYQVEASYYTLSTWDTSAQVYDPTGSLFSPFTNFGHPINTTVDFASLIEIHQTSNLENGEINLKRKITLPAGDPMVTLLIGLRHVGIREEFDYFAAPAPTVTVNARTNNNLWGPQIGGIIEYGHQDVWLRFEGKAALCENDADRDLFTNVGGTTTTRPRNFYAGTATVADINATLLWRCTDALEVRIGYQALWVDQIALAGRNYTPDVSALSDTTIPYPINTRGTLVYHGPFAGLQICW